MWLVIALCTVVPLGLLRNLGAGLGWMAYRVFKVRRAVTLENIRASLPEVTDGSAADRIALSSYQNLGRSFVEYAGFAHFSAERLRTLAELEGFEHLDVGLSHGKGIVFVTGHVGNWELVGASMARRGYPIHYLVGEQTNHSVDRLMNELRQRQGAGIIHRDRALRKVLRTLADNQIVCLLADQDARRGGVFVDFLGRTASTVKGPAMFAIKSKCPIVTGFIHRPRNGRQVVALQPPLWVDDSLTGDEAVRDLTQRYTDRLTDHIRNQPAEYFWGHRRWKTQPVAAS